MQFVHGLLWCQSVALHRTAEQWLCVPSGPHSSVPMFANRLSIACPFLSDLSAAEPCTVISLTMPSDHSCMSTRINSHKLHC